MKVRHTDNDFDRGYKQYSIDRNPDGSFMFKTTYDGHDKRRDSIDLEDLRIAVDDMRRAGFVRGIVLTCDSCNRRIDTDDWLSNDGDGICIWCEDEE